MTTKLNGDTMTKFKKTRLSVGLSVGKTAGGDADGAAITDEQLAKINRYALSPLSADDVYARKYLIAHNLVDRDRERFSEALLDDFATTFPGKSYLIAHDRWGDHMPLGLVFDAHTEELSPDQFTSMTGEAAKLPPGRESVKAVWAWFYIPRSAGSDDIIRNIEAGVYRHGSIGFAAADLAPVKGEYDEIQYHEYQSPGEAREASLVWLGAQQGATTQKAAGNGGEPPPAGADGNPNNQGETPMKLLKSLLSGLLGQTLPEAADEQALFDAVKGAMAAKDQKITDLEAQVAANAPLAEDGKSYRKHLVDEFVRMKTALGECEADDAAGKKMAGYVDGLPLDFLKKEVGGLSARMAEKFPDTGSLSGDARRDKSADGKGGDTDADNELIPA